MDRKEARNSFSLTLTLTQIFLNCLSSFSLLIINFIQSWQLSRCLLHTMMILYIISHSLSLIIVSRQPRIRHLVTSLFIMIHKPLHTLVMPLSRLSLSFLLCHVMVCSRRGRKLVQKKHTPSHISFSSHLLSRFLPFFSLWQEENMEKRMREHTSTRNTDKGKERGNTFCKGYTRRPCVRFNRKNCDQFCKTCVTHSLSFTHRTLRDRKSVV